MDDLRTEGVMEVARVEWSRLSGAEVEAVLGILLCREHPTATRIKPSQGDGGIDIWVPQGESAIVYQIKGYTGNIDSTRLRHIRNSWKRVIDYTTENSISLSAWYLVTPEIPTKEQLQWLRELTKDVSFPCPWRSLDFIDGLAAKYPEVIDYYLHHGKDRLEATIARLLSIAGLNNPVSPPANSIDSLSDLHKALNQFDPHFYYDFSVQTRVGERTHSHTQLPPGTVASIQFDDGERYITYNISPRFNEALKERPAPGSMTLVSASGSQLHEQIEDWVKFGTPLADVPAKNVRWDLPGGFGGSWDEARITVGASRPAPGSPIEEITLRVLDPGGSVVASLDFATEEVSSGIDHTGNRSVGYDMEAGLVRYELRINSAETPGKTAASLNISTGDPTGRLPAAMIPGVRFLATVRPPRQIRISSRNGPVLVPPLPVPQELMSEPFGKLWLVVLESLSTIQEHVMERIKFPDMETYHAVNQMDDFEFWYQAARLLRGETIEGTWSSAQMHLPPGVQPPAELGQIVYNGYYYVRIGAKSYQLGILNAQSATARVDTATPLVVHDDHIDVRIVPGDYDAVTIRMVSGAPAFGIPESDAGA